MLERTTLGEPPVELFYQDVGDGPPVVFVHGFSANHLSWYQQMPTFSEDYRCIAPDQRSFGRSLEPDGPGVSALGDDLIALFDDLDIDRAVLVGHSMGGWPAASLATRAPDRVAALVLSATPGGLIDPERHHQQMAEADDPPEFEPPDDKVAFLADAIGDLNTDSPDEWGPTREVLDELPLDRDPIREAGIPVLSIVGEADPFMPAATVSTLEDELDAETTVVEDAAHSVYYERPDVFNQRVKSFIDDHAEF